jgi:peptidyl-prolyl cis-trans isomerase B (cyclophilin B)
VATKKERQRQLAKQAHQRRMQRRVDQAKRTRQLSVIIVVVVLVLGVGIGGAAIAGVFSSGKSAAADSSKTPAASDSASPTPISTSASPSASATPSPSSTAAMVDGKCVYIKSGTAARKVSLPPATPDTKATYVATFKTNRGNIVIDLLNSKAPCTVNSFVSLADQKFFNNTPCPRLSNTSGFDFLQCGSPTGSASAGPGYEFGSENLTGATYPAGTVAMANSGLPDSNGSQFFLVFQNTSLAPSYTPFGRIVSGLNVLQNVGKHGFGPPLSQAGGGAPKEKVQIDSVTITKT